MKKKLPFLEGAPVRDSKRFPVLFRKINLLLLSVVVLAGCKKITEEPGLIGICPIVVSTVPTNGATAVSLNSIVTATFNVVMDSSTINSNTFTLKQGNTPIAGLVTYFGMSAIFTPAANFLPNTTYTGTITTGARDRARNALKENYVWSFTTGTAPDTIPPKVILTDPTNGETNVAV
ncbi:MAG: Ig-like domain-containing protein, partial [Ferruginibacter sp.]